MSTLDLFQLSAAPICCQPMADIDVSSKESKREQEIAFGERLLEAIEYSGKSKRQVALAVDVTPQSATRWALGYLDKKRIPAFCKATGCSIEWLLTGEGSIDDDNPVKGATVSQVIQAMEAFSDDQIGEVLQRIGANVQSRRRKTK